MASYPLDFSDRSSSSSNNNGGTCGGTAAAASSSRTSTLTSKMTWEGYEEDLLQAFEEFYRLGDFVDVTLICDDLTLRAHRIVLAACSHFFDRILRDSNCKHPVILLNGFEGWEIEACIEFMYRGWIQVPFDKVNELVTTAGVLEVSLFPRFFILSFFFMIHPFPHLLTNERVKINTLFSLTTGAFQKV